MLCLERVFNYFYWTKNLLKNNFYLKLMNIQFLLFYISLYSIRYIWLSVINDTLQTILAVQLSRVNSGIPVELFETQSEFTNR